MNTSRAAVFHADVIEGFAGLGAGSKVMFGRDSAGWVVLLGSGRAIRLTTEQAQRHLKTVRSSGRPLEVFSSAAQFERAALRHVQDLAA